MSVASPQRFEISRDRAHTLDSHSQENNSPATRRALTYVLPADDGRRAIVSQVILISITEPLIPMQNITINSNIRFTHEGEWTEKRRAH
jgi:hypothetical protein